MELLSYTYLESFPVVPWEMPPLLELYSSVHAIYRVSFFVYKLMRLDAE